MIKLWTIQHLDAYKQFCMTGVLRANDQFLFCREDFKSSYDWMSMQMKKRIGEPPKGVQYPIWAWYQWEGKNKRRDLRRSGYAARGTPMVQIEFEADEDSVLLSDFDDWHMVLNNSYIADSEAEFDEFYKCSRPDMNAEIEASWEKVFDLESCSPGWSVPLNMKTIQATLWELNMSQVKKVEFFAAK